MNKPSLYITKVLVNIFSSFSISTLFKTRIYLYLFACENVTSLWCAHMYGHQSMHLGVLLCHSLPLRWGLSLNLAFSQLGWQPVSLSDSHLCLPRCWGYRHTIDSCLATRMLLESELLSHGLRVSDLDPRPIFPVPIHRL